MSSIVISGDTSGAITLAAPAVAGTNTITLPASTGTVMVNGPTFSAYGPSAQSISSATYTKVLCATESWDTANCYDNATNYRFTPNVAGYYQVNAAVSYTGAGATGECIVLVRKNGSDYAYGTDLISTATYISILSSLIYMNGSTDYIELYCYQSSGLSKTLNGSFGTTYFQAALIRSA